jgi:hypothetical protein
MGLDNIGVFFFLLYEHLHSALLFHRHGHHEVVASLVYGKNTALVFTGLQVDLQLEVWETVLENFGFEEHDYFIRSHFDPISDNKKSIHFGFEK